MNTMNIASRNLSSIIVGVAMALLTMLPTPVAAQVQAGPDINTSLKTGDDSECAIAKNPTNPLQLFASCNSAGAGIFAARSVDGGDTWTYPDPADKTIADGDANQGAAACCDPTLAWDTFGNLYITYLAAVVGTSSPSVETLLSTDGGLTFTTIGSFAGSQDQPTIVAENTTAPGVPVAVWIVWNQSGSMRARGATATALGTVTAFNPIQNIPGTNSCSFGDVAVSPAGVVVQVCQSPNGTNTGSTNLLVNIDADGLGAGNFGAAITATATLTSGFDFIPPQNSRSVDAEAGLAYDRNPASPRFGRLYLVYTDEVVDESNDTDIMLRWSDNDGSTWSAPIRVNDDPAAPIRSQFLPRIATDPATGNITVCWHDARASATNTAVRVFCTVSTPTAATPSFIANVAVSDAASTSNGAGVEFGDYAGLAYITGGGPPGASRFQHPIWADTSNSTGNNPNGTANFEAYTNWMRGGVSTNEGDPHIRTVDGVNYDFQTAGEFVSLRSGNGFEVQTRQTAIATTFFPGANAHTGLATCVSVNSAVAARVGRHRVTWQPRLDGVPDPSGLELRINGVVTALTDTGIALPQGGRVVKSAVGGLEIEFPNGALLAATPGFWSSQGKWYMNVNIYGGDAFEGIMGALARGSWLPALPDGSSLGPKPASAAQRYDDLNVRFAKAWRVSNRTSLFDYAPGQSTANFTIASWPKDKPPCDLPQETPAKPAETQVAVKACSRIVDRNRRENCVFDVTVTGEVGFAKTYLLTERLDLHGTATTLAIDKRRVTDGQRPTFTATVHKRTRSAKGSPVGTIQFLLNGKPAGKAIKLDERAKAVFAPRELDLNQYRISAQFIPAKANPFLASSSPEISHPDRNNSSEYQAKPQ
jgi:hypothetical protein